MRPKALVAVLVVLVVLLTTAPLSQSGTPPEVRVVNLPPIQPVTGKELLASQELLTLLLVQSHGVLPPGHNAPEADQCLVTGVGEIYEVEQVSISTLPTACNLEAYTAVCAAAAQRSRLVCRSTCEQFNVLGGQQPCRGHTRPLIEPFVHERHCFSAHEQRTVTCVVTGWCSCDP
jgi:hypothetical protein